MGFDASPPKRYIEDDEGEGARDGSTRVTAACPILDIGISPSWEAVMRARAGEGAGPAGAAGEARDKSGGYTTTDATDTAEAGAVAPMRSAAAVA